MGATQALNFFSVYTNWHPFRCIAKVVYVRFITGGNDGGQNFFYNPDTSGTGDRGVNHSVEINTVDASNASNEAPCGIRNTGDA